MLKKLEDFISFLKEIMSSRKLMFDLAKNDFKIKYAGSIFGVIWAFIQPLMNIVLLYFVFQVGFKSASIQKVPFILWLICGMVPWFFFVEAYANSAGSLIEYSYLVKKVVFKISILPIVKIISASFAHLFFVSFIFIMFFAYGFTPSIYNIQALYYSFCLFMLLVGLSWINSTVIVFFKDLSQIIAIIVQFGFWITPICWSVQLLPNRIGKIFKLNPMYYIVEGYRDSFIDHVWFWERYNQTVFFWIITSCIFISGVVIFKKLRPHFSDVL